MKERKIPLQRIFAMPHRTANKEPGGESQVEMIGSSKRFLDFRNELKTAAGWDTAPVLLVGERGSGKELAARAVHFWGPRARKVFYAISMPAVHHDLIADELFGHARNAFTGAADARSGAFVSADKGTLFLDEIADMRPSAQAALLRIIDTGEVKAIGADSPWRVDVRIVAATNQNLSRLVEQRLFRADLYDRLRFFEIHVPPLRDRMEDVPALCAYFLRQCCKSAGCALNKPATQACLPTGGKVDCAGERFYAKLMECDWPGNVRELRLVVEGARARHLTGVLNETHLPELVGCDGNRSRIASADDLSLETAMRKHISLVLRLNKCNISRTAVALGIPRSTLRQKMKKLGIRIM
jgi:two-component system response regulator HydG